MYFANVSFTTIGKWCHSFLLLDDAPWQVLTVLCFHTGYGDLAPTTRGGRIFCCFFALGGVCVLGIALGIVGSKIIESEVETLEKAERKMTSDVFKLFSRSNSRELRHSDSSSFSYLSDDLAATFRQDLEEKRKCKNALTWWRSLCVLLLKYTPALAPLFLGAYLIARYEGWTVDETVYYMVVTSTTIGESSH